MKSNVVYHFIKSILSKKFMQKTITPIDNTVYVEREYQLRQKLNKL